MSNKTVFEKGQLVSVVEIRVESEVGYDGLNEWLGSHPLVGDWKYSQETAAGFVLQVATTSDETLRLVKGVEVWLGSEGQVKDWHFGDRFFAETDLAEGEAFEGSEIVLLRDQWKEVK